LDRAARRFKAGLKRFKPENLARSASLVCGRQRVLDCPNSPSGPGIIWKKLFLRTPDRPRPVVSDHPPTSCRNSARNAENLGPRPLLPNPQDWSRGRHLTLLEASLGSVASRRARICLSCSAGWRPTRVSETGFGEPGDPLVLVRQVQGLCTDLPIQPEETQVGRNRGAGRAGEPR